MVELATSSYDHEGIPLVHASIVSIDAELSSDGGETLIASAVPSSPESSVTESLFYGAGDSQTRPSFSSEPPPTEQEEPEDLHGQDQPQQSTQENRNREQIVGAGAAGAVLGLFVGGPFMALIMGVGTAMYAEKEGAAGDAARALGDVALVARDKFREVDGKHKIVDKSKVAASEAFENLRRAENTHHLRGKFITFASYCWGLTLSFVEKHRLVERGSSKLNDILGSTIDFLQRHQVVERGSSKLKRALDRLAEKLLEKLDQVSDTPASEENETRRGNDPRQ